MINNGLTSDIPEIYIHDYNKNSSGFFITDLEKFYEINKNIIMPHRTTFYQLILIFEGKGQIIIDSHEYKYVAHTLMTISKGQVKSTDIEKGNNGYIIMFSDEFINKSVEDIWWLNSLKLFDISTEPLVSNLSSTEFTELLIYLKKLVMESNSINDFAKENIIMNLLKTFILISERIKRKRVCSLIKEGSDMYYVIEFKKKLEENFFISKSVGYYADLLNITPKKLNKVTYEFWGKTTKHIIEERILLETKRLLLHTDKSIKEIGNLLGFSEATYFNKFFKKYVNKTPVKFRTSNKNIP